MPLFVSTTVVRSPWSVKSTWISCCVEGSSSEVLGLLRVAHRDPDRPADADVKLSVRRFPVGFGMPPTSQHLDAGPGVEHLPGGSTERSLNANRRARLLCAFAHVRSR